MKIITLALAMLTATSSTALYAEKLDSWTRIQETLSTGGDIAVVASLDRCEVIDPNNVMRHRNQIAVKPSVVVFNEKMMSFSAEKFVAGMPDITLPEQGIIEKTSTWMDDTGRMSTVLAIFDPETQKRFPHIKDITIICQLNKSVTIYSKNQGL